MQRFAWLLLLLLFGACGSDGDGDTAPTVQRSERVWVDSTRPTQRTATFPGAPTRTLRTLIWRPLVERPLPLLLLAHGFGGLPEKFEALASNLAAAGYVVVAPAFPLTNQNTPGGHENNLRDLTHQPRDLSFVLDRVLEANSTATDALHASINRSQLAVLGHSLGGVTTVGLTRKNCCRDERFTAVVLVAAVGGLISAYGADPINAGPPTLIIHGKADPTVPYSASIDLFETIDPPRWLIGLDGVTHSALLESQTEPPIPERAAVQRAVAAFLKARFGAGTAAFEKTLTEIDAGANEVRRGEL